MPDYFTYDYARKVDEVIKLNNDERIISTPHPSHDAIELVTDENAKALFHQLLPQKIIAKTFYEELLEHELFGSIVYDIGMRGDVCSIRFSRELTEEEISQLDTLVSNHKNNV